MRTIGRGLTVLAVCLAIGLHWIALQSVAWTTMIVANARQDSLAQAVAKTFDGNHPCGLCKSVNTAQHSSQKPETLPAPAKPDLICLSPIVQMMRPFRHFEFAACSFRLSVRTESPPVPPPRALRA